MKRFFYGAGLVFKGILFFYREKTLWKHIAGPLCILAAVYALGIWLILHLSQKLAFNLENYISCWPEFFRSLLAGTFLVAALLFCAVVVVTTVSGLFEIFGGLFFDGMLEEINKKYYCLDFEKIPFRKQLFFTWQGIWYGIKSALIFIILFIVGIFVPFLGQLLLVSVVGIRMGYSLLFAPGFLNGESVSETCWRFKGRELEVAGFGICVYLCQLFPFAILIALPGMVAGALMLYNGREPQR